MVTHPTNCTPARATLSTTSRSARTAIAWTSFSGPIESVWRLREGGVFYGISHFWARRRYYDEYRTLLISPRPQPSPRVYFSATALQFPPLGHRLGSDYDIFGISTSGYISTNLHLVTQRGNININLADKRGTGPGQPRYQPQQHGPACFSIPSDSEATVALITLCGKNGQR